MTSAILLGHMYEHIAVTKYIASHKDDDGMDINCFITHNNVTSLYRTIAVL